MSGRVYNNTIGEGIYNQIEDYDKVSRMVFLKKLPTETRKLCEFFLVVQRQRRYKENTVNKEKANGAAKLGMQKLRETRLKEDIKEQHEIFKMKLKGKCQEMKQQQFFKKKFAEIELKSKCKSKHKVRKRKQTQ